MSFLDEAHRQWHQMYGKYRTCDLDCGAGEGIMEIFESDHQALVEIEAAGGRGIRCGHCQQRHASTGTVKVCGDVERDAKLHDMVG